MLNLAGIWKLDSNVLDIFEKVFQGEVAGLIWVFRNQGD